MGIGAKLFRPMRDAPRDGKTVIWGYRKRAKTGPRLKHLVVRVVWTGRVWKNLDVSGNVHTDKEFRGWHPAHETMTKRPPMTRRHDRRDEYAGFDWIIRREC